MCVISTSNGFSEWVSTTVLMDSITKTLQNRGAIQVNDKVHFDKAINGYLLPAVSGELNLNSHIIQNPPLKQAVVKIRRSDRIILTIFKKVCAAYTPASGAAEAQCCSFTDYFYCKLYLKDVKY